MTEPSDHPARVRVVSSALALHAPPADPVDPVEPPPQGAVLHPPTPGDPALRKWFLVQLWHEARLAARMYFDPRYRISRTTQFLTPVILGLFVLNYFFFVVWFPLPLVGWVVGPVLNQLGCVALGVLAYKLLQRELARYQDVLDYLARYSPR
jgi:hypothetical protein